jgi:hypothetical protein
MRNDIYVVRECICKKASHSSSLLECCKCGLRVFHEECMKMQEVTVQERRGFECPSCASRVIDPLNQVQLILAERVMRMGDSPSCTLTFAGVVAEILGNPRHAIEVRCFRLDAKYLYEISWPDYA